METRVVRREVRRGTTQGGVLSPRLWLLLVNVPLKKMENQGVKVVGYTGVIVIARGKYPGTLSDLIEVAHKFMNECNGLGVNAART